MERITILLTLLVSFSLTAAPQLASYHHRTPQSLLNALSSAKQTGENIQKLIYTKDNQWLLATATKRWYSNASYFQNLKGAGSVGLWNRLEADARAGKNLQSLGITNRGNWVVVYRDGTVKTSSRRAFTDNGLITQVNQINGLNSRVVKVFLNKNRLKKLQEMNAVYFPEDRSVPKEFKKEVKSFNKVVKDLARHLEQAKW